MNLPTGPYDCILADCPWRFALRSRKNLTKAADHHYETMTLDDIKAMPVVDIAANDCLLGLWTTAPMQPQGLDVLNAWGFEYSSQAVWVKLTKTGKIAFGTGYRFRNSHEILMIGTRGKPKLGARNIRSVFGALAREHSRKPPEQYSIMEAMTPWAEKRIEIFSRESAPGWDHWGNEAGKFDE